MQRAFRRKPRQFNYKPIYSSAEKKANESAGEKKTVIGRRSSGVAERKKNNTRLRLLIALVLVASIVIFVLMK